eukprot:TRINITY_DN9231_c0_g1_i1.p1 TRINITY_DN9231_c0_g1~~TRINITY_DN9231_c0_g1_i1.p1  ORF type:complete len:709 (+),score=224.65 TRINITY_DN9231_c0_g1_i1:64-2190(+)
MNAHKDDEAILELISDFLASRNLVRTSEVLIEEKATLEKESPRKLPRPFSSSKLSELLGKLKNLDITENGALNEEDRTNGIEGPKAIPNHGEDLWSSKGVESRRPSTEKKKNIVFSGLAADDSTSSEDNSADEGYVHYTSDSQSSSRAASRSASRTSSNLRPRSESVGSTRSSKSVSFATSDEDTETSTDSDEYSGDEDPGYTKVPMEDFFQYSSDEEEHRDTRDRSRVIHFEETSDDKPEEYVEAVDTEESKFDIDWQDNTAATQDTIDDVQLDIQLENTTQEDIDYPSQDLFFAEPASQDVQLSSSLPMETIRQMNESFTQEEFDIEKFDMSHDAQLEGKSEEISEKIPGTNVQDEKNVPFIMQSAEYETFHLPIIYEKGRTGLEESKDYPIQVNNVIAGRYQILEYIGSAAFSKAIRCLDLKTQYQVCIKIIKNNKEFFDQSLDEIKLLKLIHLGADPDAKNVLQIYDYFYHKEHLFIVCELLRDNLYEFYKYNRDSGEEFYFTLDRLKKITKQCLIALEYIHSLNLIHCDLKPENILIKSYSRCEVKIIDFGSSCFTNDHLSTYVQSRSYRAPEVILGLPYSSKIDLWSLGCILAELWSGKVLFHNESIPTLLARVIGILGPFSEEMLAKGKCVDKYFTKTRALFDKREGQNGFSYLKPKRTSLRQRLKCDDPVFVDFLLKLLSLDPKARPSATEALRHSFVCD